AHAQLLHKLYQAFVDPAQHHLGDLHCIRIGHPESVDKLRLHSDLADPFADLFAASVYDDRLESDELEQCDVLDHTLFQILIHHGAAAVFHHDDLTVKALDVRQSLDQHL